MVADVAQQGKGAVPLYGMFEMALTNPACYDNPFADVQLDGAFLSPSGREVCWPGFYDGDGRGGDQGPVWKQRFMPDEVGNWRYELSFSDGTPAARGSFACTAEGALPGPWRPDTDNPHWLKTARGEHFLPIAMHADCSYTPIDWRDAIHWCEAMGFNTLVTSTFNTWAWPDGYPNVTAFATADLSHKRVDYQRLNLRMWRQWDDMLRTAGEAGLYIAPFNGPDGFYGGRRGKYPPVELAYEPAARGGYDTPENLRLIRYLVARQGAFWNLAYWALCATEIFFELEEEAVVRYGEHLASLAPDGRMITAQDAEQWHGENRRWLSRMDLPAARKLNAVQTAVENPNRPHWTTWQGSHVDDPAFTNAGPNNELALDCYAGFPVFTTEGLWEGQGRATRPLRIIWGFYAAGAHTMWADWRSDDYVEGGRWTSIGRGWTPVKPLDEHLFRTDQLGINCVGHKQLLIATRAIGQLEYWKMNPHNELVAGSREAYCLAEPGAQYVVYAPNGGPIQLDLAMASGTLSARWLDPGTGKYSDAWPLAGGVAHRLAAPSADDWVLVVAPR